MDCVSCLQVHRLRLQQISPKEKTSIIHTYLPDMSAPGAVKKGEVELVAGCVLKNSKMAGMLTDIKVTPTE